MIGYILIMLGLLAGIGGYLYWHCFQVMKRKKYLYSALIVAAMFVLMVINRLILGFVVHLIIGLVLVDIIYGMSLLIKKPIKYRQIIALVLAIGLSGYGMINVQSLHDTRYTITSNQVSEDKRFLVVSDLHLSTYVQGQDISKIEDKARQRDVDAIFILGDLFDESTKQDDGLLAIEKLDALAKDFDIFYIEGNHDLLQNSLSDTLVQRLYQSDVHVLQDEVIDYEGLNIIGMSDESNEKRKSLNQVMSQCNQDQLSIMLDHQPVDLNKKASLGVDIELSGHTHNGQIWPIGWLCSLFSINEVEYGHQKINNMDVIVSSGMGVWGYSMRSQGINEMVELNIHTGGK